MATTRQQDFHVSSSHRMRAQLLERDKPCLLFVHGLGCSSDYWAKVWHNDELAEFSLLSVDLLGFGGSDKPNDFDYRLEQQADALLDLIVQLNRPVHLVAHSMGGAVSTLLLPRDEILSVINIEGNLIGYAKGALSKKAAAQSEEEFVAVGFDRLKRRFPDYPRGYLSLTQCTAQSYHRSACSLVKWMDSGLMLEKFLESPKPKCYIHGDSSIDFDTVNALGNTPTMCVPESGHFPMVDNPDHFCHLLGTFLRSRARAGK